MPHPSLINRKIQVKLHHLVKDLEMNKLNISRRQLLFSLGQLLSLSLISGAALRAQDAHSGHDMSQMKGHEGHVMPSDADPHAGHVADTSAPVKRSMMEFKLTPTPLVRQDGTKTTLSKELEGNKPTVLAFFYTSCTTVCPVTSQILAGTQALLGKDLQGARIVSISIDPEYDTPERLTAYAKKFDARAQWQHYTGTMQDSIAAQKVFGAYRGDKMNHVPLIFVNGGGKKSWVQLQGFPTAEQVVKEFREQKSS
jgi:protein SCO1/2